jgi:hypothetical protein
MSAAAIAKCWTFVSSSGDRRYQTLLYVDGTTSCDCPGWCRRVAADGSRSCKHTRSVVLGMADRECQSSHDYRSPTNAPARTTTPASRPAAHFGQIGRRRIQT